MKDVGAIDDVQSVADIVVGDQHAEAAILEVADQLADLADVDRVDPGQGLVEQDEARLRGERPGDLDAAPLAAGQRQRRRAAQGGEAEVVEQPLEHGVAPVAGRERRPRGRPGYCPRR